ncbi:MarR family transcriptional regulator [soil metagenome]
MTQGDLIWQLRSFQLALQSALDEALREIGLTAAQLSALEALKHSPGESSAELARSCGVTPQTMNGIVQILETNGLLVREPHRVHGRILRVYLSNAGESKLEAGRKVVGEIEERMVATMSEGEVESLQRFVSVCEGSLSALARRNGRGWSRRTG